jgi:hypothetical protein
MRSHFLTMTFTGLLLVAGCSDGTDPTESDSTSFADLSGEWTGEITGTSQGYTLQAAFLVTVAQAGGELSGTWSSAGAVTGPGIGAAGVEGSGTLTATVEPGDDPAVEATFFRPDCDYSTQFAGIYETASGSLTMSGSFHVLDPGSCGVLLTFPTTVAVDRQ